MIKKKKVVDTNHYEKVSLQCIATRDGYFGGIVRKEGKKFLFDDHLKNGEFPTWMEPEKAYESAFSKLNKVEAPLEPAADINNLV